MKELILELMQNADDNGYPVWGDHPEQVAAELINYTDMFEEKDFWTMIGIVEEIQKERNNA